MDEVLTKFIYQPNVFLEMLLLVAIIASIFKPQFLTALSIGILLIRPNERMELQVPFIQIIIPVLSLVIIMNLSKLKSGIINAENKYLIYFIILILVQTLLFYQSDIVNNFMYIFAGLLLYFAVIIFMDYDDGIKLLCSTIIISCFIICYEPIYYHYAEPTGSELWNMFHIEKTRLQAWGMWSNANETAFIACIGVANALLIVSRHKKKMFYIASVLLIPFFALVVFLTASRAGLASLLLIFFPFVIFIKQRYVKVIAIVSILCALMAAQSLTPKRTDAEGSSEERGVLRDKGMQLIKEEPLLGVGFGRARYELGSKPAHNTYIQAFAETGIPGGLLLMLYLFDIGKKVYSLCVKSKIYSTKICLTVVVGLFCSSIFYFNWGNQLLSIMFFLIMAQITNFIIIAKRQQNSCGEVSATAAN